MSNIQWNRGKPPCDGWAVTRVIGGSSEIEKVRWFDRDQAAWSSFVNPYLNQHSARSLRECLCWEPSEIEWMVPEDWQEWRRLNG